MGKNESTRLMNIDQKNKITIDLEDEQLWKLNKIDKTLENLGGTWMQTLTLEEDEDFYRIKKDDKFLTITKRRELEFQEEIMNEEDKTIERRWMREDNSDKSIFALINPLTKLYLTAIDATTLKAQAAINWTFPIG